MCFDSSRITPDYGDPAGEAVACRTAAALFDFSFMSRALVMGPGALKAIATLTRRPLHDLRVGRIRYALRESPSGHLAADLTVWRVGSETFEVMSGRPVDIADLAAAASGDPLTRVSDLTDQTSIFAVQGPRALDVLRPLMTDQAAQRLARLPYYATADFTVAGTPVRIGRLGYTGERGFELVLPASEGEALWKMLAARARPAGFIAADALRIEAGFVLFANEFRLPVTAAEVGLDRFTGSNGGGSDWGGADQSAASDPGCRLSLVSFRASTKAEVALFQPPIPLHRPDDGRTLLVTSACNSIIARGILGLGYVRADRRSTEPLCDPTGTFCRIELAPRPCFDPDKRRPRAPWD